MEYGLQSAEFAEWSGMDLGKQPEKPNSFDVFVNVS